MLPICITVSWWRRIKRKFLSRTSRVTKLDPSVSELTLLLLTCNMQYISSRSGHVTMSHSQHSLARPRVQCQSAAASVSSLLAIFSLAILKLRQLKTSPNRAHTKPQSIVTIGCIFAQNLKSLICIIWEERIKRKSHCAIIAWQNTKETWQSTYEIDGLFLLKWAVSLRCFSGRESRATAGCH